MAIPLVSRTRSRAREFVVIRTYSFNRLSRYLHRLILFVYNFSTFHFNPFFIHLFYFVSLVFTGSLLMMVIAPSDPNFTPRYVDMLFMSTSALTVSGLGTVETERLSSGQIVVLMLLMLFGGDVFVTLLGLLLGKAKPAKSEASAAVSVALEPVDGSADADDEIDVESVQNPAVDDKDATCMRYLGYVVAGYHATFHIFGVVLLLAYFYSVTRARNILNVKGINVFLFCLSTTISSFANGGLIATNENMAIFNRDPIVLLLMIAQVVAGNLLFPLFLRWTIWALQKFTKREEFGHMLKNSSDDRFSPLLPWVKTKFLSATVVALMATLLVFFCAMDWNGAVFAGLNWFEKIVAALFIASNSRHAGENSIDPSLISPAVLVFIIVMMFLPSRTSFWPFETTEGDDTSSTGTKKVEEKKKNRYSWVEKLLLSQLSIVIFFIVLVCITERRKMDRDPINFSTMRMAFEVTSGYGNVGLSTGYSCSKLQLLHPDAICQDRPISLVGWWSDGGKLILALVMLYGRLKNFSAGGGKAWKLY